MVFALLLALAAAYGSPSLVGDWAFVDAHRDAGMPVAPCTGDRRIRYASDGTWRLLDEAGRGTWERRGDVIRERATPAAGGAPAPAYTFRLRWFGRDRLNMVGAGGTQGLIRCPPPS